MQGVRLGLLMAVDEMRKHQNREDRATQTSSLMEITDKHHMAVVAAESLLASQTLLPPGFPFPFTLMPTGLPDTPVTSSSVPMTALDVLNLKMEPNGAATNANNGSLTKPDQSVTSVGNSSVLKAANCSGSIVTRNAHSSSFGAGLHNHTHVISAYLNAWRSVYKHNCLAVHAPRNHWRW